MMTQEVSWLIWISAGVFVGAIVGSLVAAWIANRWF